MNSRAYIGVITAPRADSTTERYKPCPRVFVFKIRFARTRLSALRFMRFLNRTCIASLLGLLSLNPAAAEPPTINVLRAPERGIQPQAAIDRQGVVHLIYYKGDP